MNADTKAERAATQLSYDRVVALAPLNDWRGVAESPNKSAPQRAMRTRNRVMAPKRQSEAAAQQCEPSHDDAARKIPAAGRPRCRAKRRLFQAAHARPWDDIGKTTRSPTTLTSKQTKANNDSKLQQGEQLPISKSSTKETAGSATFWLIAASGVDD